MEQTIKLQDVILKAPAKKIRWLETAEIAGDTLPFELKMQAAHAA
jgi:hypothetical protein